MPQAKLRDDGVMVQKQPKNETEQGPFGIVRESHRAYIHIFDEHRGIAHRCTCGRYVVHGLQVETCSVCLRLIADPQICGVEPIDWLSAKSGRELDELQRR